MIDKESKELDILLTEYKRLTDDIQRLLSKNEKVAGFWLIIMSSLFGFALKENLEKLFLIIPPLFLLVFFYLINLFEFIMITGGHAAAIEIRVNKLVGAQVLRWESQLTKELTHNRFSTTLVISFFLLISMGVMFYSIYLSFAHHRLISIINLSLIFISLPIMVLLFIRLISNLHGKIQEIVLGHDINK